MNANRFWIEIVALGTAIACALALLIATLGAAAVTVAGDPEAAQAAESSPVHGQTYEGMVTCSRCGAKHSADLGKSAADCARQCVHFGATFALVDGDRTYLLDGDWNLLKRIAGQRARIVGVVQGKTIKVLSLAAET